MKTNTGFSLVLIGLAYSTIGFAAYQELHCVFSHGFDANQESSFINKNKKEESIKAKDFESLDKEITTQLEKRCNSLPIEIKLKNKYNESTIKTWFANNPEKHNQITSIILK